MAKHYINSTDKCFVIHFRIILHNRCSAENLRLKLLLYDIITHFLKNLFTGKDEL